MYVSELPEENGTCSIRHNKSTESVSGLPPNAGCRELVPDELDSLGLSRSTS